MPAKIRTVPRQPTIVVPDRVGLALRPDLERDSIPIRKTLSGDGVPYGGEEREANFSYLRSALATGASFTAATLRRGWELVGFTVDPGTAAAPGLTAQLRVLGRGINGVVASVVVAPGNPQSFVGFFVASRCELVINNPNPGGGPASRVGGELWGMNLGLQHVGPRE